MIVIVANPAAGRAGRDNSAAALGRAKEILETRGKVELVWAQQPGEAAVIARSAARAGAELVIAAGGDGTLNEAANGLAGTDTALSVIPLGTENVLAKFARLPRDPEQCVREIFLRPRRKIDLGKIGDRYFLSFAGVGFDARVIQNTGAGFKKKYGALAFAAQALREFCKQRHQKSSYRLTCDGLEMKGHFWFMLIGNISRYGWQLPLLPGASPEDGKLDACVFPASRFWSRVRQIASVFRGNHYEKTACFQFKELSLESNPPMEIQVDGEVIGRTPCRVSVKPKSLWIRM